jgi:hypothetical protein
MRRALATAAVWTALAASGCGTVLNLTDIDRGGREAFGGVARDVNYAKQHPFVPLGLPHGSGNGKALLGFLAVCGLIEVTYLTGLGAETSLSLVADACTAPILPWLNHVELFPGQPVPRPALYGEPIAQPAAGPICPPTQEAEIQWPIELPRYVFPIEEAPSESVSDRWESEQGKNRQPTSLPDSGLKLPSLPDEPAEQDGNGTDLPVWRWPWQG